MPFAIAKWIFLSIVGVISIMDRLVSPIVLATLDESTEMPIPSLVKPMIVLTEEQVMIILGSKPTAWQAFSKS